MSALEWILQSENPLQENKAVQRGDVLIIKGPIKDSKEKEYTVIGFFLEHSSFRNAPYLSFVNPVIYPIRSISQAVRGPKYDLIERYIHIPLSEQVKP